MKQIDGNEVDVGDVVKVIHIRDEIHKILTDDEMSYTFGMLNNDFEIEEFVNNGTQICVSYSVKKKEGCMHGGLYHYPSEFKLVKRKSRVK
jgi:hypothetical protein